MKSLEDVLAHHGVKGMKWGVRKDSGHEGEKATNKKIAKLDTKFDKNASTLKTFIAINNMAAEKANSIDVPRINGKSEYKNADFTKPSALRTKYYKEHEDAFIKRLDEAAASFGTNASGTRSYGINVGDDGSWGVHVQDIQHASDIVKVDVTYDETGHIVSLSVPAAIISHHGIKGMKWGVRRSQAELDSASEDAKAADAAKAKVKTGGTKSLSNKELQALVTRMNLEQQFSNLHSKTSTKRKGHKIVLDIVGNVAKQQVTRLANDAATKAVNNAIQKGANLKK